MEATKPKKKTASIVRGAWPLLKELLRPRRRLLALGVVLVVFNRAFGLVLPASAKILVDNILTKHQVELLVPMVLSVLGATVLQGITTYALTQLLAKEGARLVAELRRRVQDHVVRLPVTYFDSTKTATLALRIMWDVEGVRNLVGTGMVDLIGGLLTATFSMIILMRMSVVLTLTALVFIAIFGVFMHGALKHIGPIIRRQNEIVGVVMGRLVESIAGVRVVKGYNAEAKEAQVFSGGVQRLLDNLMRSTNAIALMMLAAIVLVGVVGTTVMYLGAQEILAGRLTLGGFMMFTAFLAFMVAPMAQAVGSGTQLTEALAGLDRTQEVLREQPEDEDPARTYAIGAIDGQVLFDHVTFAYEAGNPVLHDISFEAKPGSTTALVGPSGSGKSTIISLIAAFHKPTSGLIQVDGTDLSTVRLNSYRSQLGVVLQETFLFDGTVSENVGYARSDATEAEILEACRLARVDVFVERFEKKYDTVVGERGVKLSGGQRQRVSIARAILANPRILILDEATSSLDSESEAAIQEGMEYLLKGRTTFVIAHRLSTIRRADQILVVEDGRIVERGTHDSLYASNGRYYDLYTRQRGLDADLFLAPGEQAPDEEEAPSFTQSFDGGAPFGIGNPR